MATPDGGEAAHAATPVSSKAIYLVGEVTPPPEGAAAHTVTASLADPPTGGKYLRLKTPIRRPCRVSPLDGARGGSGS